MKHEGVALDVGCAEGSYFGEFRGKHPSCNVEGVEFIDTIAGEGRKHKRTIYTGTIFDLRFKNKYHLVILNNLIEHVLDPVAVMNKVHELLVEGGKVIIETPNIDSWDFALCRKYWGGLHTPRHTYLFSTRSLKHLLQKTNFKIKSMSYLLNTDHWSLSVQNYFQRKNVNKRLFRGRTKYYKYLLLFFIPINCMQKVLHKTGLIVCIAEKHTV